MITLSPRLLGRWTVGSARHGSNKKFETCLTSEWWTNCHQSSNEGQGLMGESKVDACSPTNSTSVPAAILDRIVSSCVDNFKRTSAVDPISKSLELYIKTPQTVDYNCRIQDFFPFLTYCLLLIKSLRSSNKFSLFLFFFFSNQKYIFQNICPWTWIWYLKSYCLSKSCR